MIHYIWEVLRCFFNGFFPLITFLWSQAFLLICILKAGSFSMKKKLCIITQFTGGKASCKQKATNLSRMSVPLANGWVTHGTPWNQTYFDRKLSFQSLLWETAQDFQRAEWGTSGILWKAWKFKLVGLYDWRII